MELKQILTFYRYYFGRLMVFVLVFALVGAAFYFLYPQKFVATGSFFVARAIDSSDSYFSYEGYYGQQTAQSFTKTTAGLLESVDVQSKALRNLNLPVDETNLRRLGKKVRVVDAAPQLITLKVKENTFDSAQRVWNSLADSIVSTAEELNKEGDSRISVIKVSDAPVVKETYKNLWLYMSFGLGMGFVAGTFYFALKEYLKL